MISSVTRRVFILLLLGILVSSQQVLSGNIFLEEQSVDLKELAIGGAGFSDRPEGHPPLSARADSIEVMKIEIPVEKEKSMVKEVAMVTIVATFAAYIIYTLFFSSDDDEEVDDGGGGKELPTSLVAGTISP